MWHKNKYIVSILLALVCLFQGLDGYIHDVHITNDPRKMIYIESFGFAKGGKLEMKVTDFKVCSDSKCATSLATVDDNDVYFLRRISDTDNSEFVTQNDGEFGCNNDEVFLGQTSKIGSLSQWSDTNTELITPPITQETLGIHNIYFINCKGKANPVSFKLHLENYNVGRGNSIDYLPAGLSPIPTIYAIFSVVYIILFVVWIFNYMRAAGTVVNKVHYLMSVLVVLKFFSLLFYSIEQHFVKQDGKPNGWEIAYYIFAVLKTLFFFVIVTLIGTGWSFFKPFLSDKDKKIVMIVIPLQILDNIAMIIVDAEAPITSGWVTWKSIFRLVDIICCGAILIPIIWSIKHLREASQSDGKAAKNLQKLRLFRQFYLIVVSYIYFTRIIIYLLDATLPYYLVWMGDVFTELATLSFFAVVGYKFRPVPNNPYFSMEDEDAARLEEMRTAESD